MMPTKERATSHINEKKSYEILQELLPYEWVFREYKPDYGIDMSIEIFSEINGKFFTQGEHIYVQVKSIEKSIYKTKMIYERYNTE